MNKAVEKWLLGVMVVAGCVLLVGYVLEHDWVRAVIWVLVVLALGTVLLRRHLLGADANNGPNGTS